MPLYTAITEQDFVSDETKTKIAEEITRIHSAVMKVPKSFVRVVFLSYPQRSGYTAGEEAPTASLNCVLRSGHTVEDKDGPAEATVDHVPGADRNRYGSAGDISPGDSVE